MSVFIIFLEYALYIKNVTFPLTAEKGTIAMSLRGEDFL